jgi:hypothetical protein
MILSLVKTDHIKLEFDNGSCLYIDGNLLTLCDIKGVPQLNINTSQGWYQQLPGATVGARA